MKLPNLRQSKNGVYRYRRVVPKRYRDALGVREVKRSFKTKDYSVARKLWDLEERDFEKRIKQAERQIVGKLTDTDNLDVAREQLKREGVLEEQAPSLPPDATQVALSGSFSELFHVFSFTFEKKCLILVLQRKVHFHKPIKCTNAKIFPVWLNCKNFVPLDVLCFIKIQKSF